MCKRLIVVTALVVGWAQIGVIHADLIGRWTFDDAADLGADMSGTGNDGTVEGDATFSDEAMVGAGALLLDGTDDFINVGLGANDMLANWSIDLSITAWAKPDDLSRQWNCFFGHAVENNGVKFEFMGSTFRFTTLAVQDYDLATTLVGGEWIHVAATFDSAGVVFYANGEEAGRVGGGAPALTATGQYNVGYGGYWEAEQFQGLLDEVRIFDHVLDADEVEQVMLDTGEPYPLASGPRPKDGTMVGAVSTMIQWRAGDFAVSHNVYFGESLDDVSQATPDSDAFQGNQTATTYTAANLIPGKTYYWRVDEVNDVHPDSPWQGPVWSFWVQPATAWNPSPADGAQYIAVNPDMTWELGMDVLFHTVYFGESFEEVEAATTGGWMIADPIYSPGPLETDKTYYWRVDEFAMTGTQKGDVWSFTTLPEIPITDPSLLAWWTLDEGSGTNVLDWSGHGHHGTLVGDTHWVGGYGNAALEFDGNGDYVDFGTPADLYLSDNYTYCAWFKVGQNIRGNSGPQYILCVGSRSDLVFGVEDGVGVDGDLSLHYYDTVPGFNAVGAGKIDWLSDEWHMVVGTRDAAGHKIYLDGELKNSDMNTNSDNFAGATTRLISIGARGWTGHQYYTGVIDDVRIYDRALTETEIANLLRGDPMQASNPEPGQDAVLDIREVSALRWQAGQAAASHDVYFGTDAEAVAAADTSSAQYQGNQGGTSLPVAGLVELGGQYAWRIDEVQADGTIPAGQTWRFSVLPHLVVDDFESYDDDIDGGTAIFLVWIDGVENGTGSYVGYELSSNGTFGETSIVHDGAQSMPLQYDNSIAPGISEADRTFVPAQDWTAAGVTTLVIHFRGEADNTGQLYVKINGTKVPYAGDPGDIASTRWITWEIDLASAGVNLTSVTTLTIGIEGGDTGTLYVDDIWLEP